MAQKGGCVTRTYFEHLGYQNGQFLFKLTGLGGCVEKEKREQQGVARGLKHRDRLSYTESLRESAAHGSDRAAEAGRHWTSSDDKGPHGRVEACSRHSVCPLPMNVHIRATH